MKKFPYREEDLILKNNFLEFCSEKGYIIEEQFLEYLEEIELISPVIFKGSNVYYSKFQFYLIVEIIDNRYDTYFHRTQLSINGKSNKAMDNINKAFEEYDNVYKNEVYPTFIDFFNIFYSISEDYQNFYAGYRNVLFEIAIKEGEDGFEERVNKLHSNQTTEKKLRDKTITKILPNQKNKKVIHFFMNKYRHKYEKYIEAYDSIIDNPKILEIPDFKLISEFISQILVVMEWYFNTNNIPYKRRFFGKVTLADSNCIVCGTFFKRRSVTQVACSTDCTNKNKNMLKKRGRKINKDYGA